MIRALGFSENTFDCKDPGRLCRGRERWIEPWDLDGTPPRLHRIVVSGAMFTDDGAGDARRGLPFSGVDPTGVIEGLYGADARMVAFMEDGHPADIPPDAQGVEAYVGYRAGGRQQLGLVRWFLPLESGRLRELLGDGPLEDRIRGIVILDPDDDAPLDDLVHPMFELVGFSTLDSPPARYNPSALPDLLKRALAVVVVHRDKHGPALAVYARDAVPELAARLGEAAGSDEVLLVPFAIPPMLARWDRALAELRTHWTRPEPFPVPAAPPSRFGEGRDRRRGRFRDDDELVDPALDQEELPVPSAVDDAEE
ncbi:MAG: hypothetical protein ABMA64_01440 [Myxococcota bacterium]